MQRIRTTSAPSESLYTSSQVRENLGISSSTLLALVDKGIIQKVTPPGKKQGYYTKESVDDYARQQEIFLEAISSQQKGKITTRLAIPNDEAAIYAMEQEVLGLTVPLETRLKWLSRNPYIDIVVTDNQVIYGHLSLLPMTMETLSKLLKGELRGWQVTEDEVLPYDQEGQYNLFVMAMAVRNSNERIGHVNASLLMREAERLLLELAMKGYLIRAIYATSRTRDGIYLSNRMGLEVLKDVSNHHRLSFKLDMATNERKFAKEYREFVQELHLPKERTIGILA